MVYRDVWGTICDLYGFVRDGVGSQLAALDLFVQAGLCRTQGHRFIGETSKPTTVDTTRPSHVLSGSKGYPIQSSA